MPQLYAIKILHLRPCFPCNPIQQAKTNFVSCHHKVAWSQSAGTTCTCIHYTDILTVWSTCMHSKNKLSQYILTSFITHTDFNPCAADQCYIHLLPHWPAGGATCGHFNYFYSQSAYKLLECLHGTKILLGIFRGLAWGSNSHLNGRGTNF